MLKSSLLNQEENDSPDFFIEFFLMNFKETEKQCTNCVEFWDKYRE